MFLFSGVVQPCFLLGWCVELVECIHCKCLFSCCLQLYFTASFLLTDKIHLAHNYNFMKLKNLSERFLEEEKKVQHTLGKDWNKLHPTSRILLRYVWNIKIPKASPPQQFDKLRNSLKQETSVYKTDLPMSVSKKYQGVDACLPTNNPFISSTTPTKTQVKPAIKYRLEENSKNDKHDIMMFLGPSGCGKVITVTTIYSSKGSLTFLTICVDHIGISGCC